jgi:hypothetical protein
MTDFNLAPGEYHHSFLHSPYINPDPDPLEKIKTPNPDVDLSSYLEWPIGKAFFFGDLPFAVLLDGGFYMSRASIIEAHNFRNCSKEIEPKPTPHMPNWYPQNSCILLNQFKFAMVTKFDGTRFYYRIGVEACDAHVRLRPDGTFVFADIFPFDEESGKTASLPLEFHTEPNLRYPNESRLDKIKGRRFCCGHFKNHKGHGFKLDKLEFAPEFMLSQQLLALIGSEPAELPSNEGILIHSTNTPIMIIRPDNPPIWNSSIRRTTAFSQSPEVLISESCVVKKAVTLGFDELKIEDDVKSGLFCAGDNYSSPPLFLIDKEEKKVHFAKLSAVPCWFHVGKNYNKYGIDSEIKFSLSNEGFKYSMPAYRKDLSHLAGFMEKLYAEAQSTPDLNPIVTECVPLIRSGSELLLFDQKTKFERSSFFYLTNSEPKSMFPVISGKIGEKLELISAAWLYEKTEFFAVLENYLNDDLIGLLLSFTYDSTVEGIKTGGNFYATFREFIDRFETRSLWVVLGDTNIERILMKAVKNGRINSRFFLHP